MRLVAITGFVVLALATGACSSSDPDVSSGSTQPPGSAQAGGTTAPDGGTSRTTTPANEIVTGDSIAGQTFESSSVTGHELVAGSTITLSFTASDLRANAGCNTMNGGYSLEDAKLVVGMLSSTMMGCEQALMDQDSWLSGFLEAAPTIAAAGAGITLTGDGVTIVFEPQGGGATPTLVGPTWTLETIETGDTASNVPADVEAPTLAFADDGTVAVFTGCNRGSTAAAVGDDGFITFEPMMTTMMSCGDAADRVQATVTTVLDGRVAFGWSTAGALTLSNGDTALIFTSS